MAEVENEAGTTPEPIALGVDFGYQPEKFGFREIGQVDFSSGSYEFDYTTVWQHVASAAFYMADDSGCSCPSPYEGISTILDLTPIARLQDLIDHLSERRKGTYYGGNREGECADLVRAYQEARDA